MLGRLHRVFVNHVLMYAKAGCYHEGVSVEEESFVFRKGCPLLVWRYNVPGGCDMYIFLPSSCKSVV